MATASFYLKEPTSENETLIYLVFRFNNQKLKYSINDKIHPDFWNPENQWARETKKFPEYSEFNTRLDNIESSVKNAFRKLQNDGIEPTPEGVKRELNILLLKEVKKKKQTLFEFADSFIEEQKLIKASGTIKAYQNILNYLKSYCEYKNCKLDFEDIDLNFYNSFINYLTIKQKLAQNTIGNKIKNLKVIMNEATERGLNKNFDFKNKRFKKVSEDTDKIYLNTTELNTIYSKDLTKKKKLEKVRDLFILGCYTGMRFSDFTQLKKENIIDGNKIKIRTQKTNDTVVIPLHPYVKEILEKYDGSIPEPLSNQKMNDYLKDIGEIAEINEMTMSSITRGGKVEKTTTEKFNLISTHTARRSFATNLYLADVPAITIMKITGHKTDKSFLRYIRISQEENANKLLNHPFFN
jgi:integrase